MENLPVGVDFARNLEIEATRRVAHQPVLSPARSARSGATWFVRCDGTTVRRATVHCDGPTVLATHSQSDVPRPLWRSCFYLRALFNGLRLRRHFDTGD